MSQVKDDDNPTSLIFVETLLGLDSVFLGGESQQFLKSPLTLQIWLMERPDMIVAPLLPTMVLVISFARLSSRPSVKLKAIG